MARPAAATNVWHLRQLEPKRRYATLVAVALDTMATLTDQILEMHNRLIGLHFKKAERKHLEAFQGVTSHRLNHHETERFWPIDRKRPDPGLMSAPAQAVLGQGAR